MTKITKPILCKMCLHRHKDYGKIYPLLPYNDSGHRVCRCGHWRINWGHGVFEEGEAGEGHTFGTRSGRRFDRFPFEPDEVLLNTPEARALGIYMEFTPYGPRTLAPGSAAEKK